MLKKGLGAQGAAVKEENSLQLGQPVVAAHGREQVMAVVREKVVRWGRLQEGAKGAAAQGSSHACGCVEVPPEEDGTWDVGEPPQSGGSRMPDDGDRSSDCR